MAEEQKAGDFDAKCDGRPVCSRPASSTLRFMCCGRGVAVLCDEHPGPIQHAMRLGYLHRPNGLAPHLAVVQFEAYGRVSS